MDEDFPDDLDRPVEVVVAVPTDDSAAMDRIRARLGTRNLRVTVCGRRAGFDFLHEGVADTLVIIIDFFGDLFPLAIEASVVPGLNVIFARKAGEPEAFAGAGETQLFEPRPEALVARIVERLRPFE
ncbi:MAG: hypothetical protein ACRERU_17940 [Methylococcales bacterium]